MKILKNIVIFITILLVIWFVISYFEITSQNLDFNNPTILSNWNFFNLIDSCLQCFVLSERSPNFLGFPSSVRRYTSKIKCFYIKKCFLFVFSYFDS